MNKTLNVPVCAVCEPYLDIYMAHHHLTQDGLCVTHSLEYDSEELLEHCEDVIESQHIRRTISMIYRMEVRRREEQAGIHWLLSNKTMRRELRTEFKQLFGEYFDA